VERRSTAARRKRAIAARKFPRTGAVLRAVQTTAKSLTAQVESTLETILTSRGQAQMAVAAEAPVPVAQEASGDGEEHTAIATLEPPPQEQEDTSITWGDTWAAPAVDTADDRSWRWQEPNFDDDMSGVLLAMPRRSLRERLMPALPFSLRERAWSGLDVWRRHVGILVTFTIICVLAVAGGIFGYQQIAKATENSNLSISSQNGNPTAPGGVIIVPPASQSTTPTPAIPMYEIGTWVSNNAPSGGTVTVFVRVVQNMQSAAGIPVSVSVQSPGSSKNYGPTKTGSSGIAKFTVRYGAASSADPVFVTATAHVNGQTLTAQTTFVPTSGSTQSTSTSGSGGNTPPDPPKRHHH
jgi:hypothetical protein